LGIPPSAKPAFANSSVSHPMDPLKQSCRPCFMIIYYRPGCCQVLY